LTELQVINTLPVKFKPREYPHVNPKIVEEVRKGMRNSPFFQDNEAELAIQINEAGHGEIKFNIEPHKYHP
jgi:hypothetical protein